MQAGVWRGVNVYEMFKIMFADILGITLKNSTASNRTPHFSGPQVFSDHTWESRDDQSAFHVQDDDVVASMDQFDSPHWDDRSHTNPMAGVPVFEDHGVWYDIDHNPI